MQKEKGGGMSELIITESKYDRIVVKTRGARIVFCKQWDLETGKEYYIWIKIDDVKSGVSQ